MIGTTISHYKILEKLGEGGMGVVYKAEDTKLDRTVALKFLPPHLADSEQDRARFIQEAKAASAINHPNICTIYGIEEHDGSTFIVMEFVDGQTLREKERGVTLKQAIDIGIQIADGLAAAHEKGIVHRDIKPENIMIRKDGIAQIMDFGLAKLRASGSHITRLTKEGSTVGTAGYMSPEQVQGQDSDHRSDIFSFGVVLYELFSGQLPFRGPHETALMYEIVNVDAEPMAAVKPELDPALDAIVLECLAKDPSERFQSVAEVAKELRRFKRESSRQLVSRVTASRPAYAGSKAVSAVLPEPAPAATPLRSGMLPWVVSGVLFLAVVGLVALHFLSQPAPVEKSVMKAMVLPPPATNFSMLVGGHLALSPDGKNIAFVATDSNGIERIWVRPVSSVTAISLAGTEGASYPFWSYDGKTIGFFASSKLKKIEASGGPVLALCDASEGRGGTWNQNGVIVFAAGSSDPLSRVSAAGGLPARITTFDTSRHEDSHRWPFFLPDGNHFLYTTQTQNGGGADNDVVRIAALDSSINKILMPCSSNSYYANGHVLFIRQSTLMAMPFNADKLEATGDAVPIAEQIQYSTPRSRALFSVSQTGVLIFQRAETQTQWIGVLDRAGCRTHSIPGADLNWPVFSPDGSHVAFYMIDPVTRNSDVWVYELARGVSSRFTFNPAREIAPVWLPNGDSIIFSSDRSKGVYNLYEKSANGSGEEQVLLESNKDKVATSCSPDGKYLAFETLGDPQTKIDLWVLPLFGERKPIPFANTEFNETFGSFSPDSRWLAYASDETGRNEVYARLLDGSGGKFQISLNGGERQAPLEGQRPTTVLYVPGPKNQVAYVKVSSSSLIVDSVRTVFDFESHGVVGTIITDANKEGTLFLAIVGNSKAPSTPITLVMNWDEELKKK